MQQDVDRRLRDLLNGLHDGGAVVFVGLGALEAVEAKTHTVKENEDVVSIAIQYGVSPSAIMDLNDLKNGEGLTPGRVLKLPANAKVQ